MGQVKNITFKDNSKAVLGHIETRTRQALTGIGQEASKNAAEIISTAGAVDTGLLRNSITWAISGGPAAQSSYSSDKGDIHGTYSGTAPEDKQLAVYIGTNVRYAEGIETGSHRKKGAVHFLKKAATEYKDEYRRIIKTAFSRE